jgi:hypothetical protein
MNRKVRSLSILALLAVPCYMVLEMVVRFS